jgi:hypothetical protein
MSGRFILTALIVAARSKLDVGHEAQRAVWGGGG